MHDTDGFQTTTATEITAETVDQICERLAECCKERLDCPSTMFVLLWLAWTADTTPEPDHGYEPRRGDDFQALARVLREFAPLAT